MGFCISLLIFLQVSVYSLPESLKKKKKKLDTHELQTFFDLPSR